MKGCGCLIFGIIMLFVLAFIVDSCSRYYEEKDCQYVKEQIESSIPLQRKINHIEDFIKKYPNSSCNNFFYRKLYELRLEQIKLNPSDSIITSFFNFYENDPLFTQQDKRDLLQLLYTIRFQDIINNPTETKILNFVNYFDAYGMITDNDRLKLNDLLYQVRLKTLLQRPTENGIYNFIEMYKPFNTQSRRNDYNSLITSLYNIVSNQPTKSRINRILSSVPELSPQQRNNLIRLRDKIVFDEFNNSLQNIPDIKTKISTTIDWMQNNSTNYYFNNSINILSKNIDDYAFEVFDNKKNIFQREPQNYVRNYERFNNFHELNFFDPWLSYFREINISFPSAKINNLKNEAYNIIMKLMKNIIIDFNTKAMKLNTGAQVMELANDYTNNYSFISTHRDWDPILIAFRVEFNNLNNNLHNKNDKLLNQMDKFLYDFHSLSFKSNYNTIFSERKKLRIHLIKEQKNRFFTEFFDKEREYYTYLDLLKQTGYRDKIFDDNDIIRILNSNNQFLNYLISLNEININFQNLSNRNGEIRFIINGREKPEYTIQLRRNSSANTRIQIDLTKDILELEVSHRRQSTRIDFRSLDKIKTGIGINGQEYELSSGGFSFKIESPDLANVIRIYNNLSAVFMLN